jgi:ElaB/YqjD/DUF883 family membrane-anchored ribosome-binding protein
MTQPNRDLDELKAMEKKSAELRSARKKSRAKPPPASPPAEAEAPNTIQELTAQVEQIAKEMETVAKDHPSITLLAAFAAGIAVGQLMSHR